MTAFVVFSRLATLATLFRVFASMSTLAYLLFASMRDILVPKMVLVKLNSNNFTIFL